MKKIAFFPLTAVIVCIFALITSCEKDDQPDPPSDLSPAITFIEGADFVSQDTAMETAQFFKIGIDAQANAYSQKNLTQLRITRSHNSIITYDWDTIFNLAAISFDLNLRSLSVEGLETIEFTITDIDGKQSKTNLTITTQDLTPSISFKVGADYISQDAILNPLQQLKIGINAGSNAFSQSSLKKLNITRTFNNTIWFSWDTLIDVTAYSIDVNLLAMNVEGVEKFEFTITDNNNKTAIISLNITTQESGGAINSYTEKILGSYNSLIGASFASMDGTVYGLADAKTNSGKIDWLYFYGVTNAATIASPDDADAQDVYSGANGIVTWDIINATRFKRVVDNINWEDITDDKILIEQSAGVDQTKINLISVGDLISFVTASGKAGMIKVDNIISGSDGNIDISVKVQQ